MRQIILADQYEAADIVKEEKDTWVRNILMGLGLPVDEIHEYNKDLLLQHDLQIWDDLEHGDVEIFQNNILIGKWYGPELIAKCDEENKIYFEIHLDYDSILDNEFNFVGVNE